MDVSERRDIVARFLRRCVTYADSSIERKKSRGVDETEISEWRIYRQFTSFSASEVESGELDTWLEDGDYKSDPARSFPLENDFFISELSELSHDERRNWLASLMMPRPVAIIGTVSSQGIQNLAPMSSIGVVSNSPPLVTISISKNRNGKERDTLVNLRDSGIGSSCMVFILPADIDAAKDVQASSTELPINESEWDLINEKKIFDTEFPILPSAMAAMKCKLIEIYPLPENSTASLVILRVESIMTHSEINASNMPSKLMQIDFDKLGPSSSPDNWEFEVHY
jgi:flavin reductase (DIM6/NTAB) family NADH-FMN oxidoreductase RutF|tara:strand:- start:2981 stop:3832 length:852 start_codon:yes stop_codon:yes gene_type:complete